MIFRGDIKSAAHLAPSEIGNIQSNKLYGK